MQNMGVYLVLIVVGALIGASVVCFITINQNSSTLEQVKVTIQDLEYNSGESVFKIELLNDAPEKNLQGKIVFNQAGKEWTSDVKWYYTGYGEAEILCDSIEETRSFNIKYVENNPKATYLEKTIDWDEVHQQYFTFMETEELKITSVNLVNSSSLTVNVRNTGTNDVKIIDVTVSGSEATMSLMTITSGETASFNVTITGELVSGKAYTIELLSSKGNKFSYTFTA